MTMMTMIITQVDIQAHHGVHIQVDHQVHPVRGHQEIGAVEASMVVAPQVDGKKNY